MIGPRIPILMYHQVTPDPDPRFVQYSVTPEAFESQMRWLEDSGFTTVEIGRVPDLLAGSETCPRRPVVITFDDGFAECAEWVIPVLRAHGFTATFYLVAGLVGESSRWLIDDLGVEFALLDWEEARRIVAGGFEVGSHCLSHVSLTSVGPEVLQRELQESRRLLEEHLERDVVHLSYPFGKVGADALAAARAAGYSTACTTRPGIASQNADRMLLPRVYVGEDARLGFRCRLATSRTPREWSGYVRKSLLARIRRTFLQMDDVIPPRHHFESS